jgi:hypothetical protein
MSKRLLGLAIAACALVVGVPGIGIVHAPPPEAVGIVHAPPPEVVGIVHAPPPELGR